MCVCACVCECARARVYVCVYICVYVVTYVYVCLQPNSLPPFEHRSKYMGGGGIFGEGEDNCPLPRRFPRHWPLTTYLWHETHAVNESLQIHWLVMLVHARIVSLVMQVTCLHKAPGVQTVVFGYSTQALLNCKQFTVIVPIAQFTQ